MTWLLEFWDMIWPLMGEGLLVTLKLSIGALFIGVLIGIPVAMARVYGPKWLQRLAAIYVDLIRGTPLLVQLFIIYYGLADPNLGELFMSIGLPKGLTVFSPMTAAYVALGMNSGAYQAEYFRGALQAVGSGQMMAARAIGMTRLQAIIHIVIPQALRLVIAPWSNEAAYMVKYTSVVSLIAVQDLFGAVRRITSKHYNQMLMLPFVGLVYLVIVLVISWLMRRLENRTRIPGLEIESERL